MNPLDKTVREAREELRPLSKSKDGGTCPVCTQHVQVYPRTIHSTMARALILMHRHALTSPEPGGWLNLPELLKRTGLGERGSDTRKLRYWDLIEQMEGTREDGSPRTGWWRVTPLGHQFVRGHALVPKRAHVFNERLLGLDDSTLVSIRDCLGKKFDYDELMGRK